MCITITRVPPAQSMAAAEMEWGKEGEGKGKWNEIKQSRCQTSSYTPPLEVLVLRPGSSAAASVLARVRPTLLFKLWLKGWYLWCRYCRWWKESGGTRDTVHVTMKSFWAEVQTGWVVTCSPDCNAPAPWRPTAYLMAKVWRKKLMRKRWNWKWMIEWASEWMNEWMNEWMDG